MRCEARSRVDKTSTTQVDRVTEPFEKLEQGIDPRRSASRFLVVYIDLREDRHEMGFARVPRTQGSWYSSMLAGFAGFLRSCIGSSSRSLREA